MWNRAGARAKTALELELKEVPCNYDRCQLSQKIRSGLLPGNMQLLVIAGSACALDHCLLAVQSPFIILHFLCVSCRLDEHKIDIKNQIICP